MFAALILICSVGPIPNCIEAHDTRGPYRTEESCEVRVAQMIRDVAFIVPPPYEVMYRCEQVAGI